MKSVPDRRKKIITANAIRQGRYVEKMKERGMKRVSLWVTPEQESLLRTLLLNWGREEDGTAPEFRGAGTHREGVPSGAPPVRF